MIVLTGDDVILAAWPTRKLHTRHGTPPIDAVHRTIPPGWRAVPDGLGAVPAWQVTALAVVGLAGVASSACLATSTAPALAATAALAGWALVAVGLVAAWSSWRVLRT